jgi:hypothetical protein
MHQLWCNMNKITKTLAIVGVVLAIGAALSAFAQQVAFADVAASSASGTGDGSVATAAGASPFGATSCAVGSPFPVAARGGLEERTECVSG